MKTGKWIGLLGALLVICLGLSRFLLASQGEAAYAQISSQGKVIATVALNIDRELTVQTPAGGINVVTVKDGGIAVTEANCPDGYCIARGYCHGGREIVCLPNRLVIRFLGEQPIDGVTG